MHKNLWFGQTMGISTKKCHPNIHYKNEKILKFLVLMLYSALLKLKFIHHMYQNVLH